MSAHGPHLNREQQLELGQQVHIARGVGVDMKTLSRIYNRHRAQLWRYEKVYLANLLQHEAASLIPFPGETRAFAT